MLPAVSSAVHNTIVFPNGKTFGALFIMVTAPTSVAVALPSDTVLLLRDVASTLMSFGGMIFGAVVSTTSTASVAFAFPIDTTLSFTLVASIVMSFGMIKFGGVVSLTVTV